MITNFYVWDFQNIFVDTIQVDNEGPIPAQGTFTKPPKLSGTQVAQWNGAAWVKLPKRPEIIPPEIFISNDEWNSKIAAKRYAIEIGGTSVSGISVDTGRDSQALLTGATLSAVIDPNYVCNWKTAKGFIKLDSTTLITLSTAIREHVQACFDRESDLQDAVNNGTITEQMLNEGWPT